MRGLGYALWLLTIALFAACYRASEAQSTVTATQPVVTDSALPTPPAETLADVRAVPTDPPISLEERGDIFEALGKYQAAIEVYAKIQEPSASVWNLMGIAYQMMLDSKDAERCYKKSLKLDPNDYHAHNNLGTVEDSLQEFPAAEREYQRALRLSPKSATILRNLGTNLLMQHQYGRGSDAYAEALAIDPHIFDPPPGPVIHAPAPVYENGTTSYFRARSCARAGLTDCALDQLRRAFNEGSATLVRVANENDFEGLRGNAQFEALLAEQK